MLMEPEVQLTRRAENWSDDQRGSPKKLCYASERTARASGIGYPDISPSVDCEIVLRGCRTLKAQKYAGVVYWNLCYAAR